MGKKYYCEYCDKSMVSSPNIIKTHNQGLVHQRLVKDHYQKFKDPETILAEEAVKKQCSRFFSGHCQFGSICRYSHYSPEQINELRMYVSEKNKKNWNFSQPSFQDLFQELQEKNSAKCDKEENTVLCDSNGVTHVLPWTYNPVFEAFGNNLPPSLKKFQIEDFLDANITTWG